MSIKIICKEHNIFEQTPSNHYKYGCLICSGKYLKNQEWFISEATIIHEGKYDYSESIYKGMFKPLKIKCPDHGAWNSLPTNHIHGEKGCSKCSHRISKNEIKWLNSLGIPNDKNHRNVYIKVGNNRYFADGYDPVNKICYEYNGDYYHGNLEIYKPDDYNKSAKRTFKELWERTENKKKNLENAGYKVISIWESEWLKIKANKDE